MLLLERTAFCNIFVILERKHLKTLSIIIKMFSSHDAFTIALQALFFTKVFLLEIHREKKETQIVWKMYYSFIIPFKYTMMLNNYAYKVTSISIYPSQHSVIYIHTAEPLRWIYAIDCRPLLSFAYMYSDIR